MIEYISIFISVMAIVISAIGIYQTKKNTKLASNQFLFSTRLEIVNIYRAVTYTMKDLAFIDLSDNEEYYCDIFEYTKRSKNLFSIIRMEFTQVTNHSLFHELYKLSEAVGEENFEEERIKFLLFRNTFKEKIATANYLFSEDKLEHTIIDVLSRYDNILQLYTSIFLQMNNISSHESIRVLLLTYKKLYTEVKDLENAIKVIDKSSIEKMIKAELQVF
ncbi:hypothetical protein [Enterococcus faecium]|uniref:hypothetical protein n=2 Tax=Enterococcus faecium TaxID=1352 RepID=UPI000CF20537|nr:hypothetical protein [Enterococcus faecium]PQE68518.1 hypothetical protein CUS29_13860 [Enterococcus faecium]PQG92088.1 hypothetical protein CUS55_12140 [Enterococcus faecium]RBS35396.1 hypothetical protein EB14_00384 [Enterococcus faecium]